jgi:rhodanese-related sulfurtransferase
MPFATDEELVRENSSPSIPFGGVAKTPEELVEIVSQFAASGGWMDRVRLRLEGRWYERLYQGPDHDIWAISWMPGQSTGYHDHGESVGAFVVVTGVLEEHRPGEQALAILAGQPRGFGADYAHDVRNESLGPAVSIHAYSPPLSEMNEFELDGGQLVPRERASERVEALGREQASGMSIERVLAAARARLGRLSAEEAHEASVEAGAILVDIRPEGQRAIEGVIPGALVIERNVLEWRFDPASSARLAVATGHDVQVVVFCSEGYTSSLAAAALQDLGLWRATDVVGGFQAWRAAGLPVAPVRLKADA